MAFAPIGQGFDQSTTARRAIGSRLKSGWISPVPVLTVACRCCRAPAARPASVPTACRARFGLASGSLRDRLGVRWAVRAGVGTGWESRHRSARTGAGGESRCPKAPAPGTRPSRVPCLRPFVAPGGSPVTTPEAGPGPHRPTPRRPARIRAPPARLWRSVRVRARPARHDFRGEPPTGADRTSAATPAPVRPWHPTGVRHRTQPPTSPAGRPTSPPATGAG